jgi:thiol-disulfide isomerase/thioredoxin
MMIAHGLFFILALSFVGNDSGRTVIHFGSENCPACKQLLPAIAQLTSEGWKIQSIEIEKDAANVDRWHVRELPTLIVLENGLEVDRIVGRLEQDQLRRRLKGEESAPVANDSTRIEVPSKPYTAIGPAYGPNHPMFRSNFGPNHPAFRSNRPSNVSPYVPTGPVHSERLLPSFGINHPYYSLYAKPKEGTREVEVRRPRARRAARSPRTDLHLPTSPESMAATVRIRVKYDDADAVGTGTIIHTDGEKAWVLTCGHIFGHSKADHQITIDLFPDGKVVSISGKMLDYRNDALDLGLITFRHSSPVTKIPILPKGEQVRERDAVFSIGCDEGDAPSRYDTVVSKLDRYLGPTNIEIEGAPVQGRSGGGLFDRSGRLIGVCVAADNDLDEGLFVGPEAIYGQLAKHRLDHLFEKTR